MSATFTPVDLCVSDQDLSMDTDPESNFPPRYDDDKKPSDLRSSSSSRQDPFDTLATETIGDIFGYVCPEVVLPVRISEDKIRMDYDYPNPEVFSIICKRWRAISTTTHSLWATIIVYPIEMDEKEWVEWGFSQLRRHLDRSGAYPLNICIEHHNEASEPVIHSILDIAMMYSERWHSIGLKFVPARDLVKKIETLNGRLPLLRHLEFYPSNAKYSEDIPKLTAFLSAPTLSSICILPSSKSKNMLRKICIPRTQISEVTFKSCDFGNEGDLREILACISASLTSLTFSEHYTRTLPGPVSRVVMLPQLRRVYFLYGCVYVLGMLICPSLEELEIYNGDEETITRFLDGSWCALKHFKLCSPIDSYQTILTHSSLSTLRSISLEKITDQCLDLLDFDSFPILPSLETLHLYLRIETYHDTRHLVYFIEKLQKIIHSRTHTEFLDLPEPLIDGRQPESTKVQRDAKRSLKTCVFYLHLEVNEQDKHDDWKEEPIRALQLFCIARKVRVSFKVTKRSFPWNRISSL